MGPIISIFAKPRVKNGNNFIINFMDTGILSEEVYRLLEQIKNSNAYAYATLLQQLDDISDFTRDKDEMVYIKGHHFNMVVRLIFLQAELIPNILMYVNKYLEENKPKTNEIIQNLRIKYLPRINHQAQVGNLAHHSLDHGVEIKVRSMQVITSDLGMYTTDSDYDVFMRNVISFALECHDYFQGEPAEGYATVEEQTADFVINCLLGEDGFPNLSPEVIAWIRYQIIYLIPIATTVAFSIKNPVHLTNLLRFFEEACRKAKIQICAKGNELICLMTNVIANIVGCFDTIPYVMRSSIKRQAKHELLTSETYLKNFSVNNTLEESSSIKSLISYILSTEEMQKYFNDEDYDCNLQAYETGLISKFGMTLELANKNKDVDVQSKARLVGDFIREMKIKYSDCSNMDLMLTEFDSEFAARGIGQAIESLFMQDNTIAKESAFSKSNLGRAYLTKELIDLYDKKKSRHYCLKQRKSDSIIEVKAIEADSINIVSFFEGYKKLNPENRIIVLKEIALNLITQAGLNYLKYPVLEDSLDYIPEKLSISYANNPDYHSQEIKGNLKFTL